jgi:PAS domain S-box-containing protein
MSAESKLLLVALALTALAVVVGIWLLVRSRSSHPAGTVGDAPEQPAALPEQTALLRAVETLGSELDPERVLPQLVEQLAELLHADTADYYFYEPNRRTLRCAAVHGLPRELVGFEVDVAATLAAGAIDGRRPIATRSPPVSHPAYESLAAAIVAPLVGDDGVSGVLGVGRTQGEFTSEDADFLGAFAGLAALAIRNAETFAERSRQERVQRGFYRIASVLGQPLSLAATLDAIAQAATEALGGSSAAVLMPRAGVLELVGSHELPDDLRATLAGGLPDSAKALATAATERRILAASSVVDDDRFDPEWRALAVGAGASSLLAAPVESPRHGSGGLVLVFFAEPRELTDDDLELAIHLADATGGALERSDLFEAERTSRALAQQLARTGSLLATELDPAAVLDEVVQQAPALLGAEACAIRLLAGDELVVQSGAGPGTEAALGARSPSTGRLLGDVVQSRAPVAIDDIEDDNRHVAADPVLRAGHRAFLGVPLIGPERTVHGVLAVYSLQPRAWLPEEIDALSALASNTSAALSNAELYQSVAIEKERSFAILANIADGIVAVDRQGEVVLWNAAAELITGIPQPEALGRTPLQVLGRNLESEGDLPVGDRLLAIQRGGEDAWLSITEAIMRDPAGAVSGRIFAFRDISADRFVEQMKSDFVSTVSHELRTPLTSIYGFAETLLRQDVQFGDEERETFLRYIASEAERLTGIVDALLNVARLDTGDLHVNISPVDVRPVVSEVVSSAEAGGENGHRFVVDLPTEPLRAEADPDKLRQIVAQLVDNAVKYSPSGGTVTIAARRKTETVEFSVADEGIGIPQAEQQRIFRKFYRADSPVDGDETRSGTGLGLFIAQGLVTAMGGRIWVESAEGRGSSFAFELPAARVRL